MSPGGARVPQQSGGMIHGKIAHAVPLEPLAMLPRDAEIRPDEPHGRNAPEADDDARLQQPELPLEPAKAGILFLRLPGRGFRAGGI